MQPQNQHQPPTESMTAGNMIEKLATVPPDYLVLCQVVGQQHGAWNMMFSVVTEGYGTIVTISASHPDLQTLPPLGEVSSPGLKTGDLVESRGHTQAHLHRVTGIHLGAVGQESLVELVSITAQPAQVNGVPVRALVPISFLEAGVDAGIFTHYRST